MISAILPEDHRDATLIGRIWHPAEDTALAGPCLVVVKQGELYDLTPFAPTCAGFMGRADRMAVVTRALRRAPLLDLETVLQNSCPRPDPQQAQLLAPIDLQCIKAAGVTFADSLLERIIEERAGGDWAQAERIRDELSQSIGVDLSGLKPGSRQAERLARRLREQGLWSQYLEVGLGPDAEIFTKAPVLSAVGYGQEIGVNPASAWSNPEPEVVLVVNGGGEIVGATLGNDVNLRDFEGRSALLLARGKDNNASCALGPFVRLFDEHFNLDDVRALEVTLDVTGQDGYLLNGSSSMTAISRDVAELARQTLNASHQYPDGYVLMTGTLFAPTQDREQPGMGFTHHPGDRVSIASSRLGTLINTVTTSDQAAPWQFGIGAFMQNLQRRQLL
ncbi:MAG: fumarylacetoacetate hydrolase family protein [Gammaproteobacteria bacterium]|nr:fumarylacetoacetate hydrolase family protein [Gammaproteobacteria bacterium]